ncbi:MAG: threonine synthase, partial [Clostridiales bacterium]|nr:threonine synthase [Clostridiales bacterium]
DDYIHKAAHILGKFFDTFSEGELLEYCTAAYKEFCRGLDCEHPEPDTPAQVIVIDDYTSVLELWHGPTCAFKDIALQLFPHLLLASAQTEGEARKPLVLVATSGDTGKAMLAAFDSVPGTRAVCYYPHGGVSEVQRRMMTTQSGGNVTAVGVRGDFDDCQRAVKRIFNDTEAVKAFSDAGYFLCSANSINLARLLPQVVYYFTAYLDLVEAEQILVGDRVNFAVPTGNFGDILAGYYAYRMGLPVGKLILASNANDVLVDFMHTGIYDISDRTLKKTTSPAMDILVSSNLERLLFEVSGRDDALIRDRMRRLQEDKVFSVSNAETAALSKLFYAGRVTDETGAETLKMLFENEGYLCDPHTACAVHAMNGYAAESGDEAVTVVISTAHPYKFAADVLKAVGGRSRPDEGACMKELVSLSALEIPDEIALALRTPERHTDVVDAEGMQGFALEFAKDNS